MRKHVGHEVKKEWRKHRKKQKRGRNNKEGVKMEEGLTEKKVKQSQMNE
jgi:hypothetical protein